jgi:glycosyltransferase involved in cell wall biosynthesis
LIAFWVGRIFRLDKQSWQHNCAGICWGNSLTQVPQPGPALRIAMLANNPCLTDARIRREAEALAGIGHTLVIFAHWKPGLPAVETVNGVEYRRFPMRFVDRKAWRAIVYPPKKAATPAAASNPQNQVRFAELNSPQKLHRLVVFAGTRSFWLARGLKVRATNIAISLRAKLGARASRQSLTPSGDSLVRHARHYSGPAAAWKPNVVHSHDLYTLLAGVRIAKRTGAKLVYDSHELEVGRSGSFTRREILMRASIERALISRTDGVITVCDSIADFLAAHYKINRPEVVHNAPALTIRSDDDVPVDNVRDRIGLALQTPLAIYVGSVTFNRGIEQSVRALTYLPGVHLATVGPRNAKVEAEVLRLADELGVRDRLHLIDPVPHDEVTSFVRTADVSLVTVQNVCLSYKYCFPNKLLESLLSGVPVVVARLDELERMVALTGGGVVVDETDPRAIAAGIDEIVRNRADYLLSADVTEFLRQTYSWEFQIEKLKAFYERMRRVEPPLAKAG